MNDYWFLFLFEFYLKQFCPVKSEKVIGVILIAFNWHELGFCSAKVLLKVSNSVSTVLWVFPSTLNSWFIEIGLVPLSPLEKTINTLKTRVYGFFYFVFVRDLYRMSFAVNKIIWEDLVSKNYCCGLSN